MKPKIVIILIICLGTFSFAFPHSSVGQENYPATLLSTDLMEMKIYLPDAQRGYYRGTRFEWSGLIQYVKYEGHTFFGDWKTTHDPTFHEDANAVASEFGMFSPLGYEQAEKGEPFVKMGVGKLKKMENKEYKFFDKHPILEAFPWVIEQDEREIKFIQESPMFEGWKYSYTKRIILAEDSPRFNIEHILINNGLKAINTDYYCHNFTMIDNTLIGPAYELLFPFDVGAERSLKGIAKIESKKIIFLKPLRDDALFTELTGWKEMVLHNHIAIRNTKTGAELIIRGDQPPYKFNFYAAPRAVCPEPYIEINLEPGERMEWTDEYRLHVED